MAAEIDLVLSFAGVDFQLYLRHKTACKLSPDLSRSQILLGFMVIACLVRKRLGKITWRIVHFPFFHTKYFMVGIREPSFCLRLA